MMNNNRIFAERYPDFQEILNRKRTTEQPLGIRTAENAVILPMRRNEKYPEQKNQYNGGVCDNELNFIAGSAAEQRRFSCAGAYAADRESIMDSEETVVFGGVFYTHFGIMLLFSLSRFWWITEHPGNPYRIIFLTEPGSDSCSRKYCEEMAALFGIERDRYDILTEPTRFRCVIIPEEMLSSAESEFNIRYPEPYHFLRDRILAEYGVSGHRRIYMSRRKYTKGKTTSDGINEEYYESFFEKRGYYVYHPQELPLAQQIRMIASADEIVSTYGTLSHMASFFSKPGARVVMLLRSAFVDPWFTAEAALLQMLDTDWYIVEASRNPYPAFHDCGAFLYYPTEWFRRFLERVGISYAEPEMTSEITDEQIKQYIVRWLECYSGQWGFQRLERPDLFPVMQSLYYYVTGTRLEEKDYLRIPGTGDPVQSGENEYEAEI